jgi:hypothetical protein
LNDIYQKLTAMKKTIGGGASGARAQQKGMSVDVG